MAKRLEGGKRLEALWKPHFLAAVRGCFFVLRWSHSGKLKIVLFERLETLKLFCTVETRELFDVCERKEEKKMLSLEHKFLVLEKTD